MNDSGLENPSFATVCLHKLIEIKGVTESHNANGIKCKKTGLSYSTIVDPAKSEPAYEIGQGERKVTPCKRSCEASSREPYDDTGGAEEKTSPVLRLREFIFMETSVTSANDCNSVQKGATHKTEDMDNADGRNSASQELPHFISAESTDEPQTPHSQQSCEQLNHGPSSTHAVPSPMLSPSSKPVPNFVCQLTDQDDADRFGGADWARRRRSERWARLRRLSAGGTARVVARFLQRVLQQLLAALTSMSAKRALLDAVTAYLEGQVPDRAAMMFLPPPFPPVVSSLVSSLPPLQIPPPPLPPLPFNLLSPSNPPLPSLSRAAPARNSSRRSHAAHIRPRAAVARGSLHPCAAVWSRG